MLINILTILACYAIVLSAILLIRQHKLIKIWPLLFFLTCVMLYLIIDYIPPKSLVFNTLLFGPFLLPFSFWLVSKHIFSDNPIPPKQSFAIGITTAVLYYLLYFSIEYNRLSNIIPLVMAIVSFLFILLAIYEVIKGRGADLINKRRHFRVIFIFAISIIVLITLMAELALKNENQEIPKLIQRLAILILSTYILIKNTNWKTYLFETKKKSLEKKDNELVRSIKQKMIEDNFYCQENVTIKMLAESLNEKEYIIRRTINQQLNYRNFTDFLNSYRISEAKKILADPSQQKTTVLEIAFKIGFNSIAPFNRAFKLNTGLTPTEYRKIHSHRI